jgi:hypothetical protein
MSLDVSTTIECFAAAHESVSGTFRTCQSARRMSALKGTPKVGVGQLDFRFLTLS